MNLQVTVSKGGQQVAQTEFRKLSHLPPEGQQKWAFDPLEECPRKPEVVVISGSLPQDVANDILRQLEHDVKRNGTSGEYEWNATAL